MRRFAKLFVLIVSSSAFASQPGQPLDCSDWVFLQSGLNCETFVARQASPSPFMRTGSTNAIDNDGALYFVTHKAAESTCWGVPGVGLGIEVHRLSSSGETIVAQLPPRCGGANAWDEAQFMPVENSSVGVTYWGIVTFDPVNGRLLIPAHVRCTVVSPGGSCAYGDGFTMFALTGFTTLNDISQTYLPLVDSWGFRVPVRPAALQAADRFDTYWGAITQSLDLANAHPLRCAYPSAPASPGDYLQIAAPVPTPAPGSANYILTSVTYQGQTRAGRKSSGGRLSGRDASRLPACVEE